MKIINYTNEPLIEIINELKSFLTTDNEISIKVLNPDTKLCLYSGEMVSIDGYQYIYRGYKAWVNLAELLGCKILTPKIVNKNIVQITFVQLDTISSFHLADIEDKSEKYGSSSIFNHIHKNEEPTFLNAYHKALLSVKIANRKNILNLGINSGDEFELIEQILSKKEFENVKLVGIDHSASAINEAQKRFPNGNFYISDINDIDKLNLGGHDLIISIGTLQSPSINYKPFFMNLVQNYLSENGAIILGFPNSRWIGGELIYGAMAPNYNYSEMSLLYNDVIFAKKYLQQKKFRVTITGREYIILTATKIGSL
jgi:hypothetical protein